MSPVATFRAQGVRAPAFLAVKRDPSLGRAFVVITDVCSALLPYDRLSCVIPRPALISAHNRLWPALRRVYAGVGLRGEVFGRPGLPSAALMRRATPGT